MPSKTSKHKNLDEFSRNWSEIAERSQLIIKEFLKNFSPDKAEISDNIVANQISAAEAFSELLANAIESPEKFFEAGLEYYKEYLKLLSNTNARMQGKDIAPAYKENERDRRFKDEAWSENLAFDFIKQSYLLTSSWLVKTVENLEDKVDRETARKVDFYTRQLIDAMSPSNFFITNPEVLRETVTSNGENLVRGLSNLLNDLKDSKGWLNVRMVEDKAFEVGKNLAITPGKVIYQNELMQLIQYEPTTKKVHKTPLLVISAWINKYYILDMRPENSFIKWLVDEGYTVFAISWVNPDADHAKKTFEDYMKEGPLAAFDAIEKATGEKQVNIISYCLGGTLTASTIAYLAARKKDSRVKSATYLTTLVDFSESGDVKVFLDDIQLAELEERMKERGYLNGKEMAVIFNLMRARDLIWSFVINNYMLGKSPFPFDLLYWNADVTRLPAAMHSFYLRNMYRKNNLIKPGGITLDKVPIDLRKITTPSYILSTAEDHIAPWKSTYVATQLYKGPIRFVLSGSGHVAGVINPPAKNKYGFWVDEKAKSYPADAEEWFKKATEKKNSWWDDWHKWMEKNGNGGLEIEARKPGGGKLKPIENAPGSYVKVKSM